MNKIRLGDRNYSSRKAFVRSEDRYQQIAYEEIGTSSTIFYKGWRLLFVGAQDSGGNKEPGNSSATFSFIRGTWNMDDLIKKSMDYYNEMYVSGFQSTRFYVSRKYGDLGLVAKANGSDDAACTEEDGDEQLTLWNKRLIGILEDDVGQKLHESEDPFEFLSFEKTIWDSIDDITQWIKSESWYKEKGIPWKRGWLLHGVPGTGKTSLVKAIGEHLDLPVISFCLSSFGDKDFQDEWDRLKGKVPCIALIEDIDTVFNGRKNVTKGGKMSKPLSFDTLLNTIDGITNSDGVFTIITTNRIDQLDPALGNLNADGVSTRPGRIDRIIELCILEEDSRKIIAERILRDCSHLIEKVVEEGEGETGAQFQYRCGKMALDEHWKEKDEEKEEKFVFDTVPEDAASK